MGKIIVLEGPDGAGKSTQYALLRESMDRAGLESRALKFPRYDTPSGQNIRLYLEGAFGDRPGDVNAYAASSLYAVDRFASYKREWGAFYHEDGEHILFLDRYSTSNAIHQGAKLAPGERRDYFAWLYDYEHRLLGLPAPDLVLCLDVPPALSLKNLTGRGEIRDLHERDAAYVAACYDAMRDAAGYYGWLLVPCVEGESMRPVDDIHRDLAALIGERLGLVLPERDL